MGSNWGENGEGLLRKTNPYSVGDKVDASQQKRENSRNNESASNNAGQVIQLSSNIILDGDVLAKNVAEYYVSHLNLMATGA